MAKEAAEKYGARVFLKPHGKLQCARAKVVSLGRVYIGGDALAERIYKALASQKDVYLGSEEKGFRLFLLLKGRTGKMATTGQPYGEMAKRVSDLPYYIDEASPINLEEARKRMDAHNEARRGIYRQNVSPDMTVTCPNCGTEFRVGKQLV